MVIIAEQVVRRQRRSSLLQEQLRDQSVRSDRIMADKIIKLVFHEQILNSIIARYHLDSIIAKHIISFSSRHPVFPQEEFYRSRGEHRLQAKSKKESYSLFAGKIAVPHPGSEGASSSLILRIAQEAQRRFSGSKVRFYLKKKFCGPEGTTLTLICFIFREESQETGGARHRSIKGEC